MTSRRLYRSYKRLSKDLFQPVSLEDHGLDCTIRSDSMNTLLSLYMRYVKCAKQREEFRDMFVPPEKQDVGHEKAILAAKTRATEYRQLLDSAVIEKMKQLKKRADDKPED